MKTLGADLKPRSVDVASVALSFKEVAIDVVRGETTDFISRWYQSDQCDSDLTIWWDGDKRVVKQQLCLYGQVVEWNPIHGTRTGLVVEYETEMSSHEALRTNSEETVSEIVRYDERMQKPSIIQAIALIKDLTVMSEDDRELLIFNFRESPKLHKNARERALKAWAPQSAELLSSKRPSFWKRLGRWVFGK